MNKIEQWKPITGYEGYYEVSSYGRIRSLPRDVLKNNGIVQPRRGKIISAVPNMDGYLTVGLSKDGVTKKVAVHRLVADAFVLGYFQGAEVNHIDCNRINNDPNNLEWVTHSENVAYAIERGNHVCLSDLTGQNNPNFGNTTLHDRYTEDPCLAREKQSRPRGQNGRAIPVECVFKDGATMQFAYCGECAAHLIENGLVRGKDAVSVSVYIARAARTGKAYCGMHFRLI